MSKYIDDYANCPITQKDLAEIGCKSLEEYFEGHFPSIKKEPTTKKEPIKELKEFRKAPLEEKWS